MKTTLVISIIGYERIDITNKILGENFMDLINDQLINTYSTPGLILNLLNFANNNNMDLKDTNLRDFIKKILIEKKYKKDQFIKHLLYSLIEIYFSNNVSVNNINLLAMKNYFLNKIKNTKIFNLDDETLFMEFEDRVLNG